MINQIVIGIAKALGSAFGDAEIYIEEIEQDLQEPCFLILLANAKREQFLGSRYNRKQTFNINYFPKKGKNECYEVLNKLYEVMGLIEFDAGLINAQNMQGNIVDNVLVFTVDYNFTTYSPSGYDYMGNLTIKGRVKEYGR